MTNLNGDAIMNRKKQARQKSAIARHLTQLDTYTKQRDRELGTMETLRLGEKIKRLETCIENTYKNLDNSFRR